MYNGISGKMVSFIKCCLEFKKDVDGNCAFFLTATIWFCDPGRSIFNSVTWQMTVGWGLRLNRA